MFRTLTLEGDTVVMVAVRPLMSCSAWVVPKGLYSVHSSHMHAPCHRSRFRSTSDKRPARPPDLKDLYAGGTIFNQPIHFLLVNHISARP